MAAWVLTASGVTDDPELHKQLAGEVAAVLAKPPYGTGTSDFNSAYYAQPHFHSALAPAAAEAAPDAGGDGTDGPAADGSDGSQSS